MPMASKYTANPPICEQWSSVLHKKYPEAQTSLVSCLTHFLMSDNRIETGGTHNYSHRLQGPRVSSDHPATVSGFDLSVSDNRAMLHVGVNINYFSELQSQTSLRS